MNFSLRVVGAGDRIYRFHQIDPSQPVTDILAYIASDVRSYSNRAVSNSSSTIFSTSPMLIYDEGRTKRAMGRFSATSLGYSGQVYVDNNAAEGDGGRVGGLQGLDGECLQVRDMFQVLHDGSGGGQTGWLLFQGTRQTLHIVDKFSIRSKDGRPTCNTISITASDLVTCTVGDVKMELCSKLKAPAADMMLVGFDDLIGDDEDLTNETLLFPWIANKGTGTLKLARREGLHVHVEMKKRKVSLSRFNTTASLEDVARRLADKFTSDVEGFVVLEGPDVGIQNTSASGGKPTVYTGRAKLMSTKLMDVTRDGKSVFLAAIVSSSKSEPQGYIEDSSLDFYGNDHDPSFTDIPQPSLRGYKTESFQGPAAGHRHGLISPHNTATQSATASSPPPSGGNKIRVRLSFATESAGEIRAPVTITLPKEGSFSVSSLRQFLMNEGLVEAADGASLRVLSGRSALEDGFRISQLAQHQQQLSGEVVSPEITLHLRILL